MLSQRGLALTLLVLLVNKVAVTLKASQAGLQIVDLARRKKGWNKIAAVWCSAANTTPATLKRFWRGLPINQDAFVEICKAVQIENWEEIVGDQSTQPSTIPTQLTTTPIVSNSVPRINWDDAPKVSIFYRRTEELTKLEQWVTQERCSLVMLLGMGGIGKTTLSRMLVQQIQSEFEYIIYRSLRQAPPVQEILAVLLQFLSHQQETDLPETLDNKISRLIQYLQAHRCLLILDNAEAILETGQLAGQYRDTYRSYSTLLTRVKESNHQSCLVLISSEEVSSLQINTLSVHSIDLKGLNETDAKEIFIAKGFSGSEPELEKIISYYAGHPSSLQIAADTVWRISRHNISEFLEAGTLLLNEVCSLLERHFKRLSDLEKIIMYWLVLEPKSATIANIEKLRYFYTDISTQDLIEGLLSLQRRSLIEQRYDINGSGLYLQPFVREYAIEKFIEDIREQVYKISGACKIKRIGIFPSSIQGNVEQHLRDDDIRLINEMVESKIREIPTIIRSEESAKVKLEQIFSLTLKVSQIKKRGNMTNQDNQDRRVIKMGTGNYFEVRRDYIQGNYINMSQDLSQAAAQIQQLLNQLQNQGYSPEQAQEQTATDLANQARNNSSVKDKLVKWGESLSGTAATTTVTEVVKIALRLLGLPLP
ncbi:NB-ARC domain-containing protein [Microseira wollei]|uniref:WD-40 repeat-containing protein n=1 Tax=Microseira wollei NIES-4236 TaxID=2530354 RepID=A0AAV3XEE2_9CYAN|nr:NB-ARC domain-containing protein [Microseira wollei]GET39846.1 WD-40 repeat-containing protein [Microseira wollei NIES-4236]